MDGKRIEYLKTQAKEVRKNIITAVCAGVTGHVGGSLSIADAVTLLYFHVMHVNPENPHMKNRDRLILSKGHCGPALYGALALKGYFPKEELLTMNQPGTHLPSHCDMLLTPGVDMTAGSLGQGLSCAVGIALAAKLTGGTETVYAIIGDGESQEGQIWEASMAAVQRKLDNLIVFLDYNHMQVDGMLEDIVDLLDPVKKWGAFGFRVYESDGHDMKAMHAAIEKAKTERDGRPALIVLHTVKGKGVAFLEKMGPSNHNALISPEQAKAAIAEIDKDVI
ncbi:MAG: transketolase [Clostridiales Family XIII bacterium]|jgi:transketolase|nr:transketolase [Clostridiales Family XIII bacterium]